MKTIKEMIERNEPCRSAEPAVIFVNEYASGYLTAFATRSLAAEHAAPDAVRVAVMYKEADE